MIIALIDPEKILKWGFPGLVTIFAYLLFNLFRNQFKGQLTTKDFLLRITPFIITTIILLLMTAYSTYTDKKFQSKLQSDSVARYTDSLKEELRICNGKSASTQSLQNKYDNITHLKDSLDNLIKSLNQEVKNKSDYINNEAMLGIVNSIEDITDHTSKKGRFDASSHPELNEKILKNAIFQNILSFGADTSILRRALQIVIKENDMEADINRLVRETPKLILLKRNWLKDATLKLSNAVAALGHAQRDAEIDLELPKVVWILSDPYIVHIVEAQYESLKIEKQFLDKKAL